MKNGFTGLGLVVVGTLLAVGCGGSEPQSAQDVPAPVDNASPSQSMADDSQLPGADRAAPGSVGELNACCYARCSDNQWHGPFKTITYGNCKNYGAYWCSNHKLGYLSAKWDDC